MYMLNCYSIELTSSECSQLSDDEIHDKCTFEYGVQITIEMFLAIQPHRVRIIPLGIWDGFEKFKAFYFDKEYVANDDE